MVVQRLIFVALASSWPLNVGSCAAENRGNLTQCAEKCEGSAARAACVSGCLVRREVPSTCASCLGTQYDCGRRFCARYCSLGRQRIVGPFLLAQSCWPSYLEGQGHEQGCRSPILQSPQTGVSKKQGSQYTTQIVELLL